MHHHLRSLPLLTAAALLAMFIGSRGAGAQSRNVCAAKKQRCTAQRVHASLACHATAQTKGVAVDPACLTKAQSKLDACFARLEAKGTCLTVGDGAAITAKVDALVVDVVGTLDPALRFEDTGLTVIDHRTGLEWEKKGHLDGAYVLCPGGGASCDDPHDADDIFTWSDTVTDADGGAFTTFLGRLNDCSFSGFTQQVTSAGFAGHCDWRLPDLVELRTIFAPQAGGCAAAAPCVPAVFGATGAGLYWSSSTSTLDPTAARGVNFATGNVTDEGTKASWSYVRAVRGTGF